MAREVFFYQCLWVTKFCAKFGCSRTPRTARAPSSFIVLRCMWKEPAPFKSATSTNHCYHIHKYTTSSLRNTQLSQLGIVMNCLAKWSSWSSNCRHNAFNNNSSTSFTTASLCCSFIWEKSSLLSGKCGYIISVFFAKTFFNEKLTVLCKLAWVLLSVDRYRPNLNWSFEWHSELGQGTSRQPHLIFLSIKD